MNHRKWKNVENERESEKETENFKNIIRFELWKWHIWWWWWYTRRYTNHHHRSDFLFFLVIKKAEWKRKRNIHFAFCLFYFFFFFNQRTVLSRRYTSYLLYNSTLKKKNLIERKCIKKEKKMIENCPVQFIWIKFSFFPYKNNNFLM